MGSNLAEIQNWMKSKHIIVPIDWLEACLNWVMQEHQDEYLSLSRIKKYIYEQWLTADLEEIGCSCLPNNVFSDQKSILHGTYTLQMLDMRDISQPSYSQLLKLRGKENQNAIVSAEPNSSLQLREIKQRCMMMTLTDGVNYLKAMEYKSIPALQFALPPGTKIQICGPVDCRLGILLLTAEKVQILGGEVESLIVENSYERTLLKILGQNDFAVEDTCNQHPREEIHSFDSGIANSESNGDAQHIQNDMDAVELFPDSTCEVIDSDEFEDDDEFLSKLDYDHLDQLVQECSGTSSERSRRENNVENSSCKIRTPPIMSLDIADWDLNDFI